jgi:hypothetical protein
MQIFVREDGVEWGLTHAFFANMGGFVLSQRCLKITYNDRYANPAFIQELGLVPIRNCCEVRATILVNQRVSNDRSGALAGRVSISMKEAEGESVLMLPNNTWETTILTRSGGIVYSPEYTTRYWLTYSIRRNIVPVSSPFPPSRI